MNTCHLFTLPLLLATFVLPTARVYGQVMETSIVEEARDVLNDIMTVPARRIPEVLLGEAQAIAIVPNVIKGGFVIGVRHGRGVILVRDENGAWQAPAFVRLTGGSVGWQAGVQATDVILVFTTRESVNGLWRGKFTIGADVAAAAGPVGRQASAATDARLRAEIYSYSRSRGLFAGVALDGSALQIDPRSNAWYYRSSGHAPFAAPGDQPPVIPPSAIQLMEQVAHYTNATTVLPTQALTSGDTGETWYQVEQPDSNSIRQRLAWSSEQLAGLLDERWSRYLALPAEVYGKDRHPSQEAVGQVLARFDAVAENPQYHRLVQRSEFQTTHDLLRQYLTSLSSHGSLELPPPPASTASDGKR